jgi:Ca2+-binding RTX toxin-like protein
MGNGGSDSLFGGSGSNLLLGGVGADHLMGSATDDILVNGTAKFGSNLAVIDALLAFWSRTDLDYSTRVSQLRAGRVAGVPALDGTNVFNDNSSDTLRGMGGRDWFFANHTPPTQDVVTDLVANEFQN